MSFRIQVLAALLILSLPALGQKDAAVLQGAWSASAGPSLFHGKWTARASSPKANSAQGSWILLDDRGDILMQGTWTARKSVAGWKGTFSARVLRGRAYAGNWTASEPGPGSRTFAEMLRTAVKGAVSGAWSSGGYGGSWLLSPSP